MNKTQKANILELFNRSEYGARKALMQSYIAVDEATEIDASEFFSISDDKRFAMFAKWQNAAVDYSYESGVTEGIRLAVVALGYDLKINEDGDAVSIIKRPDPVLTVNFIDCNGNKVVLNVGDKVFAKNETDQNDTDQHQVVEEICLDETGTKLISCKTNRLVLPFCMYGESWWLENAGGEEYGKTI